VVLDEGGATLAGFVEIMDRFPDLLSTHKWASPKETSHHEWLLVPASQELFLGWDIGKRLYCTHEYCFFTARANGSLDRNLFLFIGKTRHFAILL
jgi:hypothetical protein